MSRFRYGFDTDELSRFYRDWIRRYNSGRDERGIRFGQQVCICYLIPNASFPELFNEEDAYEAFAIAYAELKSDEYQSLPRC